MITNTGSSSLISNIWRIKHFYGNQSSCRAWPSSAMMIIWQEVWTVASEPNKICRGAEGVSVCPPRPPPATEQHRIRTWAVFLWQKRAGVATQWSQPIGAQYLEGSLTCLSHVEPPGLHWSGFPSPGSTTTSIYYKLESSRLGGFDLLYFTIQWCISDAVFLLCRHLLAFNCTMIDDVENLSRHSEQFSKYLQLQYTAEMLMTLP